MPTQTMPFDIMAQAANQHGNPFGGLFVLIIIAFIGAAALNALKPGRRKSRPAKSEVHWTPPATDAPEFPFLKKKFFFSAAERSFYEVLRRVVGEQIHVFAKVRLADVVYVARGIGSWQTHFNRIQSKHIDFLLCDRQQLAPLLAMELDSSHDAEARQSRDKAVDSFCEAAGLPIFHIAAQRAYSPESLRAALQRLIPTSPPPLPRSTNLTTDA